MKAGKQISKSSNTQKAIKNTAFQFLPELVAELSGLILPRFMLLTFGSALTGLVSSINQFIKYLRKMEAGLSTASAVNLYQPLAKKDYKKVSEVVSTSKYFYRKVGIWYSIGALLLAFIYPFVVDVGIQGFQWYKVTVLVIILSASGAFSYFVSSAYSALLVADQKNYIISVITTVYGLITIPLVLLVLRTENMLLVQLINMLVMVLQAGTIAICAKNVYKGKLERSNTRNQAVMSMRWEVFFNEMGLLLETNAPLLITTFALGVSSVAVFSIYNMIFQALQSIVRISRDTLRPSFGQVWATGDLERARSAYDQYEWMIYFITSILYTIAALLILPFIRLYTHGITDIEYVIPSFALLFCLSGAIRQFQIPASVMIGAAGKFKEVRSSVVYSAIVCIALGVPGAIYFGLPGVMFAMVCAVLGRTAFTTWYINKKVVKRGIGATCKRLGIMLMATVIAVTPFMTFITIEPQSFVAWLAWGIGTFIWVSVVHLVFAYLFEKNTVSQLLDRILTSVGIKVKK